MSSLWTLAVLVAVAGSDHKFKIYIPDCIDEKHHLTDEQRVLVVETLLSQTPFSDAKENERRYKCNVENMAGEYLAEDDGWKRVCPRPYKCLYFWDINEKGHNFTQSLKNAFEEWKTNFTAMETAEGGCNYRRDTMDQEIVCLIKILR